MGYNTIIVGAGAAGCVLAARLSEDPRRSILLLEAGPDHPNEADLPLEIRNGLTAAYTHDWGYFNQPCSLGRSIALPRGKLVGGCSATNATSAIRGTPSDYDEWAAQGNPGWSFSEVLPHFRRVESDRDFDDEWHGRDGYLPIRRDAQEMLLPEHRAFLEACSTLGHARVADHNAPDAMGAGVWPKNLVGGVRQSAALTYLAAARGRSNLTIRGDALVDHVAFQGRRAIGVRLAASEAVIPADAVVLSAGAYCSPTILLRSGVGAAHQLTALGINVLRDLPGVGENLADHPLVVLRFAMSRALQSNESPGPQALLTLRSSGCSLGYDLHLFPDAPSDTATFGIVVGLMKPLSRGSVRARSSDPAAAPVIDSGYFSTPGDMPRLLEGIRVAEQLARTPPLSDMGLRQLFPDPLTTDPSDHEAAVRAEFGTYFHPVGTCRFGPTTDATAVVDSTGAVHGLQGLWVVDASIMPTIPAANTHLPTMMLAERCSTWLAELV